MIHQEAVTKFHDQRVNLSAGVAGWHFAHRWRHTYATSLVRRGEDIHTVQRLLGHASSRQPPGTCTCRTLTSLPPSLGRSQKTESGHCSDTFWFTPASMPE
ncbi:MAG: tyrosine-type recombinase/integrase [Acidimicrobiales bacterium]